MSRLIDRVVDALQGTTPRRQHTWDERNYSDGLHRHLRRHFGLVERSRMHVPGRRADLLITNSPTRGLATHAGVPRARFSPEEEAVVVEVKLDLRSSSEFKRLNDQMNDYHCSLSEHARMVVLLLGDTRDDFVSELEARAERERRDDSVYRRSRWFRLLLHRF